MNSLDIAKIVLVLIGAPILGCLLAGIDRKLTARLQGRVGPPLLQPYYDVMKLFQKDNMVVNESQNLYVVMYVVFVILSLLCRYFDDSICLYSIFGSSHSRGYEHWFSICQNWEFKRNYGYIVV